MGTKTRRLVHLLQQVTSPVILILFLLMVQGCANKQPWSDPVAPEQSTHFATLFQAIQQRDGSCPCCLDAEATLIWEGPGEKRSVTGYLQLMSPTFLKFVILNPLGQPIYAVVSNNETFQSIHTPGKRYTSGTLASLASEYNIPKPLLSPYWGDWLTGRVEQEGIEIEAVHSDRSNRGIWITLRYLDAPQLLKSHLLIQPSTRQILSRVLIDRQEETIATFSYQHNQNPMDCAPPDSLTITDLPYNSQLTIKLEKILLDREFTPSHFRLKIPPGYTIEEQQ